MHECASVLMYPLGSDVYPQGFALPRERLKSEFLGYRKKKLFWVRLLWEMWLEE